MSEETKEYIRLHMEILRESMKKEGLLFAIAVDKKISTIRASALSKKKHLFKRKSRGNKVSIR